MQGNVGLGTWRFFLAFLVVISHLWYDMIQGPSGYAVWGFYVLSGYLMTLVLTTKYGTTREGITAYAVNRFLRIYPPYIVAVALALVSLVILRNYAVDPSKVSMRLPASVSDWVRSLGMVFFLPRGHDPVPVAWALYVEVAAYALMPLLARSRQTAIFALLVGLAANLDHVGSYASFAVRYYGLSTGMVAFAAGSLIHHYSHALRSLQAPRASVLAWFAHGTLWLFFPHWPWSYGLLFSVLLSAWVVLSLAPVKSGAVDQWLGNLSYPVYLLHMIVGAWMFLYFGHDKSFAFFAVSYAITIVVSWVFVVVIDRRADRVKLDAPLARARSTPA